MSQAIYHPDFAASAFLISDLTPWVSEHLKVRSVLSDVTTAFQPPAGDTGHLDHSGRPAQACATISSPEQAPLSTQGDAETPHYSVDGESLQFPGYIIPFCLLPLSLGPGRRCLSLQASIMSRPGGAVLASWPSATLCPSGAAAALGEWWRQIRGVMGSGRLHITK